MAALDKDVALSLQKMHLQQEQQPPSERVQQALAELEPDVRSYVEHLYKLQHAHDDLEKKFLEEKAALEAKYKKMYEPLYSERGAVVAGKALVYHQVSPGDTVASVASSQGVAAEKLAADNAVSRDGALAPGTVLRVIKDSKANKGVPGFWLKAFRNHNLISQTITEKDAKVLELLQDVICEDIADSEESFTVKLVFGPNSFFRQSVLSKTFLVEKDKSGMSVDLERDEGTAIDWTCPQSQNPTVKVMKRKAKSGKGGGKPETKVVPDSSFFNFFQAKMPEDTDQMPEEEMEDIMEQLEMDYTIGSAIRDELLPHAVQWFTGEALELFDNEDFGEGDDDGDDDDEDDEDEDDDSPAPGGGKQPTGLPAGQNQECKQQ